MHKFTTAKGDQIAGGERRFKQGLETVLRCENRDSCPWRIAQRDERVAAMKTRHFVAFDERDVTE